MKTVPVETLPQTKSTRTPNAAFMLAPHAFAYVYGSECYATISSLVHLVHEPVFPGALTQPCPWLAENPIPGVLSNSIIQFPISKSVDVVLLVHRAQVRTELRLRVVATPEPATAQLLAHLGLRLPKGTRIIPM